MTAATKKSLCRELEQIALALTSLLCGARDGKRCGKTVQRRIIATERKMMSISRKLIRGLKLNDSHDVEQYVSALSESRKRFKELGIRIAA